MRPIKFLILALLLLAWTAPTSTQTWYDDPAFARFWESFSKAACARDAAAVSRMTWFPFKYTLTYFGARKEEQLDSSAFKGRFREIFSDDAIVRIFKGARLNDTVVQKIDRGGSCSVSLACQPATGTYAALMVKTGDVASSAAYHFVRSGASFVFFACEAHSN
jgi:hypothetical protein